MIEMLLGAGKIDPEGVSHIATLTSENINSTSSSHTVQFTIPTFNGEENQNRYVVVLLASYNEIDNGGYITDVTLDSVTPGASDYRKQSQTSSSPRVLREAGFYAFPFSADPAGSTIDVTRDAIGNDNELAVYIFSVAVRAASVAGLGTYGPSTSSGGGGSNGVNIGISGEGVYLGLALTYATSTGSYWDTTHNTLELTQTYQRSNVIFTDIITYGGSATYHWSELFMGAFGTIVR